MQYIDGLLAGWPGFNSRQKQEIFLSQSVHTGSGAHPASYTIVALAPRVKRPEREADHSPPSNAKVKNGGATPPLSMRLNRAVLNKLIICVQSVQERNVASYRQRNEEVAWPKCTASNSSRPPHL
jgi:hypothetical protein